MSFNAALSVEDKDRQASAVLRTLVAIAGLSEFGYPPIPRFPEWEKAIKDGIVW